MSESYDLQPAPDEPAASSFDLQPTETAPAEGDNLGVYPMPSRAEHMATLTAIQAARGPKPEQAAKALQIAKDRGLSPQWALENAEPLTQAQEQSGFEDALGVNPVLAAYAGQSGVHASAVKDDVGVLEALEQGLMDIGYQEWATLQMSAPTKIGEQILVNHEADTAQFDQRHAGVAADFARSLPSLGAFYLTGILGSRGGKAGEVAATGGLMYALNRGALYRRILNQMPTPDQLTLQAGSEGRDVSDIEFAEMEADYQRNDAKARTYATVGAGVSAAMGAGLSSAISLATPGAARKIGTLSNELLARAFTDEATWAVIDKLASTGAHTLSGALFMAVPAVVDDATVRKAVTGEIDYGKALEAGWDAFKRSLLAAGVLSAAPHAVAFVRDAGRARQAPVDAGRLDHLVEQAQGSKLRERSPAEFEQVVGKMAAQGDAPTVYIDGEKAAQPEIAAKLVEALADEGEALAAAKATGADVAVPTEKYLSGLADQHDALREDVKLNPEGMTPREAEEWQKRIADITEPLNTGKLTEIAARGLGRAPTDAEIRATMDNLRSLGFDVPELKDVGKNGEAEPAPEPHPLAAAVASLPIAEQGQVKELLAPPAPAEPKPDALGWATRLAQDKTIAELQPGRYELAARRAEDKLAEIAKQSAEKGQEAARQGFLGAGMQKLRDAVETAAGIDNLKAAGKKADKAQKLLDEVPQLEQARDLARAQAKVHAELADEMTRAREYIAKRDTDKARAELAKASPEYLDTFNTILDAIDDNTPKAPPKPLAVDQLLLRMDSDAEPVGFDADRLRDILSDSKGWKKLTVEEARVVTDAVKNIRRSARRQNEIELSDRKASLREFVDGFRTYLDSRKTPDSGPPPPSRASAGPMDRAGEKLGQLGTELIQPLRILRDRLGPAGDQIADAYVKSRNAKEELARQVGDEVTRFYELNMPKEPKKSRLDGVKGPGSSVLNDTLWTRQDLWEFASWWGSESGADRIKRGLGITDGQAHEFMSQLTSAEADFLEAKWKLNDDKLWPLIRDHTRKVTGTSPTKIEARPFTIRTADGDVRELHGGYEPARYRSDMESTAKAPEDAQTIADYWGTLQDGFPATARYFLKERAQNVSRTPDLNWSAYSGHVNSVLHYLAYDDFVRNVGRIFRDKEFRELVQRRLGPQDMQELDKFLGIAARGRVDAAQDGAQKWSQIVGGGLRSRVATAAFQLNPRIVLGQLSHLPAAAVALKLGPSDMLFGLSQAMRHSTWGTAFEASEQLPYRWNGYGQKMREQLANIGPGEPSTSRKWLDGAGWSAYHAMDGFLSKTIYEAAASKAERAGADPEAARAAGDHAVELMMPALNIAEQSSFARDRGVIGSLILVRNFPNTIYNVGAKLEWEARNSVFAADPGWQKAKVALGAYGAVGASYLGTALAVHVLGHMLMGHGKEHDESTSQWLERESLSAPFYAVPFVGDVAETAAEAAVTHKKLKQIVRTQGVLRAAPAIQAVERVALDIGTAIDSGSRTEDRVIASLRGISFLFGSPVTGVLPSAQYGYDLATGRAHPRGPFDVAGGFVYGKRKRQPKNPGTLAQDFFSR